MNAAHPEVLFAQEYEVLGMTQIRFNTLFTENESSCVIGYSELTGNRASLEVGDYRQTSESLVDTLGADLMSALDKLVLQLDERGGLRGVLNLEEVRRRWDAKKEGLTERRADIPDFGAIADDYGRNLQDEERLLTAIRDKGVHGLFFPSVKHLTANGFPAEYSRAKLIKDFTLSTDLPVSEKVSLQARPGIVTAEVTGELDRNSFDYPRFLGSSRRLFGEQLKAEDVSFRSIETYTLGGGGGDLRYTSGVRHHRFEIRGAYFKDEKLEFKVKS